MSTIEEYELRFSANNYQGFLEDGKSFSYKKGRLPIIISVPHSVSQIREGKIKYPEVYTGAIGLILQERLDVHLITKCFTDEEDPNYSEHSTYCDKLEAVVKSENIQLVLDIHGAKASQPFCIDVGTNDRQIVSGDTVNNFMKSFNIEKEIYFNVTENLVFGARGQNRVVNKVHRATGVEAMQIEINKLYRSPLDSPEHFNALVDNLSHFIKELTLLKV